MSLRVRLWARVGYGMVLVVKYLGPYGLYVAYGDNYEVLKYSKLCNLYEFILTDVDKRTKKIAITHQQARYVHPILD